MAASNLAAEWHFLAEHPEPKPRDDKRVFIPEFILGGLLIVDAVAVIAGINLSLVAVFLLCFTGLFRRPRNNTDKWNWLLFFFLLIMTYLWVVCLVNGVPADVWVKRLTKMGGLLLMTWMFITGRLHIKSALKGLGVALVINVVTFYLGVAPRPYGSLLSGWIGDKNRAGLYYAIAGLALLSQLRRTSTIVALTIGTGAVIWLTGSRTSIAAYGLGLVWVFVTRKASLAVRAIVAVVLVQILATVESQFAYFGEFATRTGSDLFRARIDAASILKVDAAPWYGSGLGEGQISIGANRWFFHNAYWVIQVEGGWPFLLFTVGLTVLLGFRLLTPRPISLPEAAAEGATFAVLVCAFRLGDVFFTPLWCIALVTAVLMHETDEARPPDPPPMLDALIGPTRPAVEVGSSHDILPRHLPPESAHA